MVKDEIHKMRITIGERRLCSSYSAVREIPHSGGKVSPVESASVRRRSLRGSGASVVLMAVLL